MNTQIQAIEREGQNEQPTNHEPKRAYPIRSDATTKGEGPETERSSHNARDKRKACQVIVEIVLTIRI